MNKLYIFKLRLYCTTISSSILSGVRIHQNNQQNNRPLDIGHIDGHLHSNDRAKMLKHRIPSFVMQHIQKLLPNEDQFPSEIGQLLPDAFEKPMGEKNHSKGFADGVHPRSWLYRESFQSQVQSDEIKRRCDDETHRAHIQIPIAEVCPSFIVEEDAIDVVACGREYDTKQVGFERAPRDVKSDEIPLLTVIGGIVGTGAIFGGHACCVPVTGRTH